MANVLKTGEWAKHYEKCINCGTREIPHKAEGLCDRCYLWYYRQARRFGYVTTRNQFGQMIRRAKSGKKKRKKSSGKTGGRKFE